MREKQRGLEMPVPPPRWHRTNERTWRFEGELEEEGGARVKRKRVGGGGVQRRGVRQR